MKALPNKLTVLLFLTLALPHLSFSQDNPSFELSYEVNRVYPAISITKEQLTEASTISDLNRHYRSSWVKEFISVEIWASHKGKTKKAGSKKETLSQAQKDLMNSADVDTDISVKIRYLPDNTLSHNDPKEIDFTFTVDPECEATFLGGQEQLQQYLKVNAKDKIADASFKRYQLTAVKFTIDKEGQVVDAHVFESSKDAKVDKILLDAICNMPKWKPAAYANGLSVKQNFVLSVGDLESCVVNLLGIRRELFTLKE